SAIYTLPAARGSTISWRDDPHALARRAARPHDARRLFHCAIPWAAAARHAGASNTVPVESGRDGGPAPSHLPLLRRKPVTRSLKNGHLRRWLVVPSLRRGRPTPRSGTPRRLAPGHC